MKRLKSSTRLKRGEHVDHFDTVPRSQGWNPDRCFADHLTHPRSGRGRSSALRRSRDVTDRKKAEAALREADRKKDEFLATLAHELRGPLAPMRNAMHILVAKGPAVTELQSARGVIDRQLQIMTRLLEDLLDVSRISSNKMELRAMRSGIGGGDRFRVGDQPAGHRSGPALVRGRIAFRTDPLEGDPVRLAQVFSNLLTNAAKYTEEGGLISLTAQRQGNDVVVSVRDNGIGIGPEMLPRIFEIFAQSPRSLERAGRAGHWALAGQGAGGVARRQHHREERRSGARQ